MIVLVVGIAKQHQTHGRYKIIRHGRQLFGYATGKMHRAFERKDDKQNGKHAEHSADDPLLDFIKTHFHLLPSK